MGPLATADFYTKLVRLTPARTDQDHLRVLIDSNPKIPDRTAALRSVKAGDLGATVRERVREVAAALIGRGAQVVVLGCTELPLVTDRQAISVPVLDGTEVLAVAAVRAALPSEAEEFPGSP